MGTILTKAGIQLPSDQEASGRTLGVDELNNLAEVIASGTLTSTKGKFVKRLQDEFAEKLGVKYVYACASGTAAVHTAIAALDPEPGDEIVTSPITDMGALTPILYQAAIPVFAEVDPATWNLTAKTIDEWNLDKSLAFYKDRFADASDFTFVFVGAFDLATMKPLVERYLGALP